jgi:hypothetical protein
VTQSVDEQLRFAIANKRLMELNYKSRVRVVEPHDYGVQKGIERVLVYQLRATGGPPTRSKDGWKLLEVPKVEESVVLEATFRGSRGTPQQRHNVWDVLYARVK